MSRAEWLRTFVAVYRTGSVTAAARARGLSQPAASQQLAALSKAVGAPVLARTGSGMAPTERGRDLYAQIAEPLDLLENVLSDLDGGRLHRHNRPLRIGTTPELFEGELLASLAGTAAAITATFDADTRLVELLLAGELDIVVTTAAFGRRTALQTVGIGHRPFALVGSPAAVPPEPFPDIGALSEWLTGQPWATFSGERPVTRQFWTTVLGRPFDAHVRVVAPDLRAVVRAVELGVGVSLLPAYACAQGLAANRIVELYDVAALIAPEPWFATVRRADRSDPAIADALERIRRGCEAP